MDQIHLFISGDVQGVGFRQFVRSKAKKLGLTGWVRNRNDGRVEVVGQGPKEQLEELLSWCKKGPILSGVEAVDVVWEEGKEPTEDFRVHPTS